MKEYIMLQDKERKPYLKEVMEINVDDNADVRDVITSIIFKKQFHRLAIENGYVFAYNKYNKLLGSFLLSVGTQDKCTFFERTLISFLILSGADTFYYIHNHPVGTHEPSEEDINVQNILSDLVSKIDMKLEDCVIVSSNGFCLVNSGESIDWTDEQIDMLEDLYA